jgi:hypothetical protein
MGKLPINVSSSHVRFWALGDIGPLAVILDDYVLAPLLEASGDHGGDHGVVTGSPADHGGGAIHLQDQGGGVMV